MRPHIGAITIPVASAAVVGVVGRTLDLAPAPEEQRCHSLLQSAAIARSKVLHATLDCEAPVARRAAEVADVDPFFLPPGHRILHGVTHMTLGLSPSSYLFVPQPVGVARVLAWAGHAPVLTEVRCGEAVSLWHLLSPLPCLCLSDFLIVAWLTLSGYERCGCCSYSL